MSEKPLVSVWKRSWLPPSETFIRAQQDGLVSHRFESVGWERTPSALARDADILLGVSSGLWRRAQEQLLAQAGLSWRLHRHWRNVSPSVIHVHFVTEAKGIPRVAARLGIPYIVTAHGNDVTEAADKPGWRGRWYRWQARRIIRNASAVVAVSAYIADRVREIADVGERMVVLPIGTEIVPRVATPLKFDVVFLGRLVEVKGVRYLLQAARLLQAQGVDAQIGIGGDGPLRGELEAYAQSNGLDVTFLGQVPSGEVPAFLGSGRIFCAPSVESQTGAVEGFGLVNLEAALQELPIVAFRTGGVPEAVVHGETGLLVEERNIVDLAEALRRLLDDPLLADRMGAAGRKRVEVDFDLTHRVADLEALYTKVEQRGRPRGRAVRPRNAP